MLKNLLKLQSGLNVRSALVWFMVLGLIFPFAIGCLALFSYAGRYIRDLTIESAKQVVLNCTHQMESVVETANYSAVHISSSPIVVENVEIMNRKPDSAEAFFAREGIINYINEMRNATMNALNASINVILLDGTAFSPEALSQLNPDKIAELEEYFNTNFVYMLSLTSDSPDGSYYNTRPIKDSSGKIIGFLSITIPEYVIRGRLQNHQLLQNGQINIYDSDNQLILTNRLPPVEERGKNDVFFEAPIGRWGLSLTYQVPMDMLIKDFYSALRIVYTAFFLICLVLLAVLIRIANHITRPINNIIRYIKDLQTGNFKAQPQPVYFEDIKLLNDNLVEMADRIDGLMATAVNEAHQRERIYYDALTAQINPHFLHNTLNSIKWMATLNGNAAVSDMISELCRILDYTLGKKGRIATVSEELDMLASYVILQKMRFGEKFTFINSVEPQFRSRSLPRFVLQPLVENSIIHGVFSMTQGEICISARCEGDYFIISVADNGMGMDVETAAELLLKPKTDQNCVLNGIGVNNVSERIKLEYGGDCGLRIISAPGEGCTVEVHLPAADRERKASVD